MSPPSIGVLLPTRNCAAKLAGHLEAMRGWLDLAGEVVVVDSFSEDGTLELVRSRLAHPRLKILSHPPGLYASWNHGLAAMQSDFAYIATVGDAITREGLLHLAEVLERLSADVVLSRPEFITASGRPVPGKKWTIHRYLEAQSFRQPVHIPPAHFFLTSVMFGMAGFLGSSASNLYRTRALQQFPFSTEFGHVGDTAWGVAHAFNARVALTPQACAQFQIHPNLGEVSPVVAGATEQKLLQLARASLDESVLAGTLSPEDAKALLEMTDRFEALRKELHAAESEYDRQRQSIVPCLLHPWGWAARRARNQRRAALTNLWRDSMARFPR